MIKRIIAWVKYLRLKDLTGKVFYNKEVNRFFQVKSCDSNGVLCSSFTTFYESAMTVILRQHLSYDYIKASIEVVNIDHFPYAHLHKSVNAWEVLNAPEY